MFEWLEQEILEIKTPRFHVVDGPANDLMRKAVLSSTLPLPASYKTFVLKFGNARLYRISREGYGVGVFAGPRESKLPDGTQIYQVGFYDSAKVYVKPDFDLKGFSMVEMELKSKKTVARDFDEWLALRCADARAQYGKKQWGVIIRGPRPFSTEEEAIMLARQEIRWQVLGVDQEGDHIFEITNASNRTLPVFTLGVRSKDGRLNGARVLDIACVHPGETATLHVDCYKGLVSPNEIEIFDLPNPGPEERQYFDELRFEK